MKQTVNGLTAAQVEEIKRFSTVTNPISAPDLSVPQAYAYSLRRAIVIDCNQEQAFNDVLTISKGDKVISKLYGSMGIVTGIRQEKGQTHYDVRFEKPIKSIWSDEMINTGDFCRFGITKNFDTEGREIVGSAVYYAEELQADYWLGKARTIFDLEILPPAENRPQWLVNYDLLNTPKLATLYEIASYLSALYQEHRAA